MKRSSTNARSNIMMLHRFIEKSFILNASQPLPYAALPAGARALIPAAVCVGTPVAVASMLQGKHPEPSESLGWDRVRGHGRTEGFDFSTFSRGVIDLPSIWLGFGSPASASHVGAYWG